MTVGELIKVIDDGTPFVIEGETASTYGFIRYEDSSWVGGGMVSREVKSIGVMGDTKELTIEVYGEV